MFISTKPASLLPSSVYLFTRLLHYLCILIEKTSDDDMFISVDLWSAPLVGPLMVCCVTGGSNRRTRGGFAEKYTHPINAKAPKRGLHYRRICTVSKVAAEEKEAGVSHQEGGMRPEGIRMSLRVTRANLLCCQGCRGQVLD